MLVESQVGRVSPIRVAQIHRAAVESLRTAVYRCEKLKNTTLRADSMFATVL